MSSTENIKSPTRSSSSPNKKRPLSEISPNIDRRTDKRKNTMGFEIPQNSKKFPSRLPQPSSSSLTIPQGILSIPERLKRKPSIYNYQRQVIPQSYNRPNDLQEEYYALNETYKKECQVVEGLEMELNKLKKIYKNHYYKIESLNDLIVQRQNEFNFLESDIVEYITREENLVDLKLKQNRIKLHDQFKELEFEMLSQLEDAKNFNDDELIKQVEEYKCKKLEMAKEVEALKEKSELELKQEQDKLEKEFEEKLEPLRKLKKEADEELIKMKNTLSLTEQEYDEENAKLLEKQNAIELIKQEIVDIEQIMINFQATKQSMDMKLLDVEQTLKEAKAKDDIEQQEYDIVHSEYVKVRDKVSNHDSQRRILENSIMEYQGNFRVYGIGVNEDEGFNKSFEIDTPDSFIIEEFQCLVKSIFRKRNVCIFNNHISGSLIVLESFKQAIQSQLKSDEKCIYQCISVNDTVQDLLNLNTPVNNLFHHQKMIIDSYD
ncbi:hypothetical protein G210_4577 [Candida maltosa Xu316]|uniref:Uncharacterized protein n=1 Tax=Candida maltosa (strain Xu316) TaxID=1245528 RepID=M3IUU1_CANMX|nr:hypothetical protein G210_4577 [Candida maltosa Xu316]